MTYLFQRPAQPISLPTDGHLSKISPNRVDRWVEALSHIAPKFGGVSASVSQLSERLAVHPSFNISLASFTEIDETETLAANENISVTHWPASRVAWWLSKKLRSEWYSLVRNTDCLHLHGLWEAHTTIAARAARALGKPYILSAHGMLDPWALASKGWKKLLYSILVERRNVTGAACLHALTLSEAEDYRRFGSRNPIAVIPNGVDLPPTVCSGLFLTRYPHLRGRRIVLFLGRLHSKKGLEILLQAWARMHMLFPDAVLVLAGPDSEGSRERMECYAESLMLGESVFFTGMLVKAAKWSALASAHAFVLPSYSEGLSVAVLEAMGMGLPVIISHECHVPEVQTYSAGWQIAPNVEELETALTLMLKNSATTNTNIGNRGRDLVKEHFNAAVVTQQMADLYRWVKGGPRPTSFKLLEVNA